MENADFWILVLGFSGQGLFASRFLVRWLASEAQGKSVVPIAFWYLSLGGAAVLFSYAFIRRVPVFMLCQATGSFVYLRNLALITRESLRVTPGGGDEAGV